MASIFQVRENFCLFNPEPGLGTQQLVSFARAVRTQNSAGEIEASYAGIGIISCDLQPQPAGVTRLVAGTVYEVAYRMFVYPGTLDLRDGDRAYLSGAQVEIVSIQRYGGEHAEIDLRYLGR